MLSTPETVSTRMGQLLEVNAPHAGCRVLSCRVTQTGDLVPIGPLECCGVCLGDTIHPASDCADLGYCSQHGVCFLGGCQCFLGWCVLADSVLPALLTAPSS